MLRVFLFATESYASHCWLQSSLFNPSNLQKAQAQLARHSSHPLKHIHGMLLLQQPTYADAPMIFGMLVAVEGASVGE
jgi:hypothetical protein